MTALELKTKLMTYALENKTTIANELTIVDPLIPLLEGEYHIFYEAPFSQEVIKEVIPQVRFELFDRVISLAKVNPKRTYAIFLWEDHLNGSHLTTFLRMLNEGINNVLPIILERGQLTPRQSDYLPLFVDKGNQMNLKQPYRRYFVTYAEGWGKLECKSEAETKIVDKKLFNLWSKNIVKIEEKREQERLDYLSKLENGNKKQETT